MNTLPPDRALSVSEALRRLEGSEVYDLLLSGISMPGRTGLSLAEEVRRRWPELAVLLVTGAELDESEAPEARRLADGFLRKPFAVDVLLSSVRDALSARSAQA